MNDEMLRDRAEASLRAMSSVSQRVVTIKKVNSKKQIIYGEVYAPNVLDTYGEMMTAEDIEKMAHRFMGLDLMNTIDVQHDNKPRDAYPVESFIARAGDHDYTEGAWVLGVKVADPALWAEIENGKLNGYSFEALVHKLPAVVEYDYEQMLFGHTEENKGHTHMFFVEMNDSGKIISGRTTTEMGHDHVIRGGTATLPGGPDGHTHRFFA